MARSPQPRIPHQRRLAGAATAAQLAVAGTVPLAAAALGAAGFSRAPDRGGVAGGMICGCGS